MANEKLVDEIIPTYSFEMFSKEGDNACRVLVRRVARQIGGHRRVTKEDIVSLVRDGVKKISETHPEVYDTEPGYHMEYLINKKFKEVGYAFEFSRYDLITI